MTRDNEPLLTQEEIYQAWSNREYDRVASDLNRYHEILDTQDWEDSKGAHRFRTYQVESGHEGFLWTVSMSNGVVWNVAPKSFEKI